ncbi:MAG: hypothetical protein PHD83_05785, partial [Caldisericia bacterium]|nr:hypothetical protein [Caldisericia bacterium]
MKTYELSYIMHDNQFISQILQWGDLGVFVGMFLESSIVPVPSEVVILTAGSIGIPLVSIVIFGSIGATLGSFVGYSIGRFAA